jgi:hypothetical protein
MLDKQFAGMGEECLGVTGMWQGARRIVEVRQVRVGMVFHGVKAWFARCTCCERRSGASERKRGERG